jgi:hypothetical protein
MANKVAMYAQCPECDHVFGVTKAELKKPTEMLICPACQAEFLPVGHLHKTPPKTTKKRHQNLKMNLLLRKNYRLHCVQRKVFLWGVFYYGQ